ncbi:MAG: 50S ribosomal protein L32 [Deltaproteobacteria bacterium]|uniref:Large ribosomal subunit protein bL32 n=1 Tax=Candidatus Desulfacyla euxinica TaxID=2841693 RepID=A0A8J6MYA6_9DELT|nr:50S ribosomal protein L32 [Candidatus Desulfacyla euxinica]MBL7217105.1 50S ribosomal protein L32 [Desulfobacteraceae bacterium]
MAVPKKKKSRSKRGSRRAHDVIPMSKTTTCPQCHEPVLPHHICPECGTYRGKTIIEAEED